MISAANLLKNKHLRHELEARLSELVASPTLVSAVPEGGDALKKIIVEGKGLEGAAKIHAGVEKIVKATGRPPLLVAHGSYERPVLDTIAGILEPHRQRIETALLSVGRVESEFATGGIGSAWVVHDDIAVTNRHVAEAFAYRDGNKYKFRMVNGKAPRVVVDFCEEYKNPDRKEHEVLEVLYIAPGDAPDIAFLRLNKLDQKNRKLPPAVGLPEAKDVPGLLVPRRELAVIGYPAFDPYEDAVLMQSYFGAIFDVKRLSPGEVMFYNAAERLFAHDGSTLGGSSGSLVIDLSTGVAVGLHFYGESSKQNLAVDAAAVREALEAVTGGTIATYQPPRVRPEFEPGQERKLKVGDFAGRPGYDKSFLDVKVALPTENDKTKLAVCADGTTRLDYQHFSLAVHQGRRQPWWTAVNIDGNDLRNPPRLPTGGWAKDPRLAASLQVGHEFYTNSGFSRGHIVRRLDPAWGTDNKVANGDTFIFTNACPQNQEFNDKFWGDLEDEILSDAKDLRMTVFTGPIFEDDDPIYGNGGEEVAVPLKFWKLVVFVRNGKLVASAFVLSQESYLERNDTGAEWRTYQWTIKDLEEATGLSFGAVAAADAFNVLEAPAGRRLIQRWSDLHV